MVSDAADDANIDLRDKMTGVHIALRLGSQHAALVIVGKQEKKILGKYGF